jgi:signal transduction histidine kinase
MANVKTAKGGLAPSIRNLRYVYLVLVGLVFLAVAIGFGLDESADTTFERSVHQSEAWARRVDDLAAMLRAARMTREPANEIFLTRKPEEARLRLDAANALFQLRQRSLQHDLDTDDLPREALWHDALDHAARAQDEVVTEARAVVARAATDPAGAARVMGQMDRHHELVEGNLLRLITEARGDQQAALAAQAQDVANIRAWEPLLAAPLLLLAVGAVVYGHRLGEAMRVLEGQRAEAEQFLRDANDHLEGRVHERTAELAVATHAAQAASMAKSRFLAAVGHELRTPLNAIIGYAEMLEEDAQAKDDAQQVADLAKIRTSGHHLLAMVNEILDLANLESDRIELECTDLEPGPLAVEVTEIMAPRAAANGNTLEAEVVPGTPPVRADLARLRQCLLALLDNACKFTQNGRIHVVIAPAGEGWVALRVADTGIGMPPDVVATVFESFVQGDGSTTRAYGGTGLGLAVVQRLVRLMGGHIDVESAPGEGARFSIVLPAALSTARATA